ncbi:transaldolase family protein [Halorubrum sp. CBA1125]|uniref:transaldolase family protein n=1 Tax=Halorubrum sp. CBA1125 TaxID=2668072 RepID=UPI0012E94136|nr:transaldolase family protein [Halorubrum sp. CBA1125]
MRIYIDTASPEHIRAADRLGVVDGVTTNPSIVADTDRRYRDVVETTAEIVDGPVFAQVLAEDADEMVREGRGYQEWAERVIVKLPATRPGFEALRRLRADDVPAGTTVVFSVEQAVLAAKNDATFVAPYVGRIDDSGADGLATTRRIQSVFDAQGFETEVLAASIRNTTQATALYEAGIDAITMSPSVLDAHIDHPETAAGVEGFAKAWGDRDPPLSE